ncbi:hypothetical protein OG381_45645 [Streptomyces sp. NBC_00490]
MPQVETVVGSETRLGRIMLDAQRWVKAASGVPFCDVKVDAETGETWVPR